MSIDNDKAVKVSKRLQERRFAQKYKHTLNVAKYDGHMWDSDGVQFFALWQKRRWDNIKGRGQTWFTEVHLDLFTYYYNFFTKKREGDRTEKQAGGITIRPEYASPLRDFLINKPTNETFLLPFGKSNYHLSFEKRGLFGPVELRWRFLYSQEEWNNCFSLPRKQRNDEQKYMKTRETREQFWFAPQYANLLASYLDMVLPYDFIR